MDRAKTFKTHFHRLNPKGLKSHVWAITRSTLRTSSNVLLKHASTITTS